MLSGFAVRLFFKSDMLVSSIKAGAEEGLFKAELSGASSFSFRTCYLSPVFAAASLPCADICAVIEEITGRELSEAEEEALLFAADCFAAEKAALQLIARAEQCAFGIGRKLEKREHKTACVKAVKERLCGLGLLDDLRYSRLWLESRLGKQGSSPVRLLSGLRAKGISRDDSEAAIRQAIDDETEWQLLQGFLAKKQRKTEFDIEDSGDRRSLKYILKGEGFSGAVIERFLEE